MVLLQEPATQAALGSDHVAADRSLTLRERFKLPMTYSYGVLLIAVTVLVSVLGDSQQTRVIQHASTNLHNLLAGRFGTLLSSAFVIGDGTAGALLIPLLVCLLILAEWRFGALSLLRIFIAGHIGATLLVAGGLWIAVSVKWLPTSISFAEDVGVSYGALAVIGSLIVVLPSKWRPTWAISLGAVAVAGVVMGRTFTNVGHLLALSIGLLVGWLLLRSGRTRVSRLNWVETALLVVAALLGYVLLVG
ncbi:rhomboid-like protein [Nocardia sp. NPDC052254]|uniref:rhomboid-like protein n=1 Tax=Nocardia sp. NPDC052254 TaxID=3155681 RepID=UPI0034328F72